VGTGRIESEPNCYGEEESTDHLCLGDVCVEDSVRIGNEPVLHLPVMSCAKVSYPSVLYIRCVLP
jgi:hypothetical protein